MKRKAIHINTFVKLLVFLVLILPLSILNAQEKRKTGLNALQEKYKLKTSLGFQFWSTYTMNQRVYDPLNGSYSKVDNRWNNQLRRSRLSISGQPYPKLSFKLTAALDLIGRDANAATQGGNNSGNFGQFGLWNMFLRWKPFTSTDLVHITTGFQPPQIGRASITGALKSNSFEKSWSQNYLRRSIVGTGPGRAMGINIGGQKKLNNSFSFAYNMGAFTPQSFSNQANSQGYDASPLFVGRLSFSIGDPESSGYSTSHRINYFGKRRGITLAVSTSHQGRTDIFDKNQALSFDFLFNYEQFNLDGEWSYFSRSKNIEEREIATNSNGGYFRLGYNVKLENDQILEPVIMYVRFNGPLDLKSQEDALTLKAFAGGDEVFDIGVNYHLNPKLKLSLTYTMNTGNIGESDPGATFNNYFRNSNKEPINRGNLLGLALVGVF